nr:unnamed protein product [Digitaria exilis]
MVTVSTHTVRRRGSAVMNQTRTHLGDAACSTHLLKIDSSSRTGGLRLLSCMCEFDGHDWEIRFFDPCNLIVDESRIGLILGFLGENGVRAALSCRLVDPSGAIEPSPVKRSPTTTFRCPSDSPAYVALMTCSKIASWCHRRRAWPSTSASSWRARRGPTFAVSGESFAAHKTVLAARSPVFMAEFFRGMMEESSGRVEIKEMEPSVFEAMLRFLYTDAVPELEKTMDAVTLAMAQSLLVAADRYGLDRLKAMCECKLASAIDTSTAATMLTLAERHGCQKLKGKCVEFIAGGSRGNLDAVMETEGFKDLAVNNPSLMAELLVAAHGRKH